MICLDLKIVHLHYTLPAEAITSLCAMHGQLITDNCPLSRFYFFSANWISYNFL